MGQTNLILGVPQGFVVATSLGIEGFARHRSPGSGKFFQGRAVYFDMEMKDGAAGFEYLDEGGWRNPTEDTRAALAALAKGGRTKTAVSNNALTCAPLDALKKAYLVKTGGHVMEMEAPLEIARFSSHVCNENWTPEQIASAAGLEPTKSRHSRLYMVLAPIEFVVFSNLTPEEYVWYATHRAGKIFRQVVFTELMPDPRQIVAERTFHEAEAELRESTKKTKTLYGGSALNKLSFQTWIGYDGTAERPIHGR